MKKIIIAVSLFVIVILSVSMFLCPNNNKKIRVEVENIFIKSIESLSYEVNFREYNWPDELKQEIEQDLDAYSIVSLYYGFSNLSEKITMKDIRFYPDFEGDIKNMVCAYNSGNGTYYITLNPKSDTGMTQNLLIKTGGKTSDEILEMIKGEKIKMIYYTGSFFTNTGYGYKGIGKQQYSFTID